MQPLDRRPDPGTRVSSTRISELLSVFREVREQRQSVMARLRESMIEMQARRAQLRRKHDGHLANGLRTGAAPASVRLQAAYGMTPREAEVAMLLAEGCSNTTVAQRLGISPHTARHHTQRVLGKLGVHSRAEAGARLRL